MGSLGGGGGGFSALSGDCLVSHLKKNASPARTRKMSVSCMVRWSRDSLNRQIVNRDACSHLTICLPMAFELQA